MTIYIYPPGLTPDQNDALDAATTLDATHPPLVAGTATTADVPESTDARYLTDNQNDAIDAATTLSASDPVAAQSVVHINDGRLSVPLAYTQTTGDQAFQINSAAKGVAVRYTADIAFSLATFSLYMTAVATEGDINCSLCEVNETGAYEPNGRYNGSTTNAAPTMTANNLPAPNVAALVDSAGANAEAGAGFEAFEAYDAVISADNGTRSNAAPTAIAPMFLCLDLGEGNGIRLNKYRFYSYNNANADVRAFPKAWTLWGSNVAAPTKHTDDDWTAITGDSTWTAETDPGAGLTKEYYVSNTTSYRHIRFKFTDRNGANAYMALGSVYLYAAQLDWSPGTELYSIGTLGSGAAADTWVRKTLTAAQQQYPGKNYCLKFMGTAGDDYSVSLRRWNTATGSMFPAGCACKTTSDTATTWTQAEQNNKPAMLNIVLNSTANHSPQLYYGRYKGSNVYLPGVGIYQIPVAGVSLDCDALTASDPADPVAATVYNIDLYDNAGTLTLKQYTTDTIFEEGLEQEQVSQRCVGSACMITRVGASQGPIDVGDCAWLTWRGRQRAIFKENPYSSSTSQSVLPYQIWFKWNNNADWDISVLSLGAGMLSAMSSAQTGGSIDFAMSLGTNRLPLIISNSVQAAANLNTKAYGQFQIKSKGLHTLSQLTDCRHASAAQALYFMTGTFPTATLVASVLGTITEKE